MLCNEVIKNLLKRHKGGFDFTLDRVVKLLQQLGNPHKALTGIIHIAGTNGKGSNTAFCRSLLEASGSKVNVHISPHLVNWRERFRINGTLAEETELAYLIQDVANIAEEDVTIFEILTACAMLLFKQYPADFNIFEVGLGGRLDATNIIEKPSCSIITPISLDHCTILGDNLQKIALEKAGIIKAGCPVIFGRQKPDVMEILQNIAREKKAPYFSFNDDFFAEEENNFLIWYNGKSKITLPKPNLNGSHQIENAATAIKAVTIVKPQITITEIAQGLQNVSWCGRLQNIKNGTIFNKLQNPNLDIWLDGAHNEAGAYSAVDFFNQRNLPLILICGMLNTKDTEKFFAAFNSKAIKCYTVPIANTTNYIETKKLAETANKFKNINCDSCSSLNEALQKIIDTGIKDPTIVLIAGSLHLVGEFLELNNTQPS